MSLGKFVLASLVAEFQDIHNFQTKIAKQNKHMMCNFSMKKSHPTCLILLYFIFSFKSIHYNQYMIASTVTINNDPTQPLYSRPLTLTPYSQARLIHDDCQYQLSKGILSHSLCLPHQLCSQYTLVFEKDLHN